MLIGRWRWPALPLAADDDEAYYAWAVRVASRQCSKKDGAVRAFRFDGRQRHWGVSVGFGTPRNVVEFWFRIIVIMFVRMKMSVEEAIKAFCYIIKRVYAKGLSPRERTEILRECMEDLLKERGLPVDLKLEEKNPNGGCLGLVILSF